MIERGAFVDCNFFFWRKEKAGKLNIYTSVFIFIFALHWFMTLLRYSNLFLFSRVQIYSPVPICGVVRYKMEKTEKNMERRCDET